MDEFLISAKHDDVGMPEGTSGGIVDFPHASGESLKPFEDRLLGRRIGDWQGKFFTHHRPSMLWKMRRNHPGLSLLIEQQCCFVGRDSVTQNAHQLEKLQQRLAQSES